MKELRFYIHFIICSTLLAFAFQAAAQSKSFRYNGNIIHNGKAIFPIGYWMEFNAIEKKEKSVEILGKAGFDMVTYGVSKTFKERVEGYFKRADTYGMRIIYGLYASHLPLSSGLGPANDWIFQDDGTALRQNPALLGYYHSDDVNNLSANQLNKKQSVVKSLDNTHMTFHSSSGKIFDTDPEYVASADAPGVQTYPVSRSWLHNTYTNTSTLVKASKLYDKVPVMHGQSANNNEFFKDGQRWITANEFDAHTYLGVVAGVKGIFYYTFGKTGNANVNGLNVDKPDIWNKSIQIKNELRSIDQVLLFGQFHAAPFNPIYDVYHAWWLYGDKVYVIAVNSFQPERANAVKNISIKNLPYAISNLTPLFQNNGRKNTLTLEGTTLSGKMQPTDVQVYVLDYGGATVPNGNFTSNPRYWNLNGDATIVTQNGNKVLKANSNTDQTSVSQELRYRILPDKTYTLSADLKGNSTDESVTVFVQFRDFKNTIIETRSIGASTSDWKRKSITFTTPESYGSAVVGVYRSNGNEGDVFIDNISIEASKSSSTKLLSTLPKQEGLRIYPNPANDYLTLEKHNLRSTIENISIYSLGGKGIREIPIDGLSTNSKMNIDTSELKEGIHILKITFTDKETQSKKFMVKH